MPAAKRTAKAQNTRHQRELALKQAYRKTTYAAEIDGVNHDIRVGRRHGKLDAQLRLLEAMTWACITAWNPQSVRLPAQENARRNVLLEKALHERQIRWHPMHATGDAGDWPTEEGVLALGTSRAFAESLGRRFGQAAVVWGRVEERAELVWCNPPARALAVSSKLKVHSSKRRG